ncbi:MAG: RHS repeat protein, partial [Spirochaetes bacterium]|nr:RHS repeat protein [Spirochaetota bacterium]
MNKQLKKAGVILFFTIILVVFLFADYTVSVKIKDAWTEVVEHPGTWVEDGYWDCGTTPNSICEWVDTSHWDPPAWTETIEHPAEYQTVTVQGDPPADIDKPDQSALNDINNALQKELENQANANGAKIDADAIRNTAENSQINNINGQNVKTNESLGQIIGDPIRFATGDFIFKEIDINYMYINREISVERNYQSDENSSHSFGKGWRFNWDTRIIHGVKPNANEEANLIEEKYIYVKELCENSDYNEELAKANQALSKAYSIKQQLDDAISNLYDTGYSSYPEIYTLIYEAQRYRSDAISFIDELKGKRDDLVKIHNNICLIRDELQDMVAQSRLEANIANSNESRNMYVVNNTDPEYLQYTGNETITIIDENGTPHLYYINEPPNYNSTSRYADGSINYYKNGASTTPSLPTDDKLDILPDGSYVITKKDKSKYYYSFYGQIKKIVDTNCNEIACIYNENQYLIEIKDDFGRSLKIEMDNEGRILKTVDPSGREYNYGYNGNGHLSEVTDPAGDMIRYVYDGNQITEIIKPDGSSRIYIYENLNGRMVMTQNIDEEGNTEYFEYNKDEKYTEYSNDAGTWERYYYNDKFLTTKIEYQDESYVEMEYDDNNNMVKKVDELGLVYEYDYDNNRNLIEAIDPEGNIESWTFNPFNKISSYIDKMENTTEYSYDSNGNLITITYPDLTQVSYEYNSNGLPLYITDQTGDITCFEYDDYGYTSSI